MMKVFTLAIIFIVVLNSVTNVDATYRKPPFNGSIFGKRSGTGNIILLFICLFKWNFSKIATIQATCSKHFSYATGLYDQLNTKRVFSVNVDAKEFLPIFVCIANTR